MDRKSSAHVPCADNGLIPTARAVVDVNRVCNAKCQMCYYRHSDQRWTKPFEEVVRELRAARERGCTSVDFTGGEPTLHPDLPRIVATAEQMGLHTCTITAGLALSRVRSAVAAGCREWLVSMHGLGDNHDEIVAVKGAWGKVNDTVDFLNGEHCTVRVNCTLTQLNAADLPDLARHFVEAVRPRIVNFINFNPHHEWGDQKDVAIARKLNEVQIPVSEVAGPLREAVRYLDSQRVWTNVRYFPFCALRGMESHICNNPQVMFDPYEWDYGVAPKTTAEYLRYARERRKVVNTAEGPCASCGVREVCGGANANYVRARGNGELTPYEEQSDFPYYFRSDLEADIVVPAYVPSDTLGRLLESIPRVTAPPYNLIVVGNHQSAARNRNYGLERARSPYVIMCDDDIADLPYGWNRQLVYALKENRELAAVSARLMTADGRPGNNNAENYCLEGALVPVEQIPTACSAFRRTEVRFDERFIRAGWEDTDYFMQLRTTHGGGLAICNLVRAVHLNQVKNGGGAGNTHNARLFAAKWSQHAARTAAAPAGDAGGATASNARTPGPGARELRAAAVRALESGDYRTAAERLRGVLATGAADVASYNQLGVACWNLGERENALQSFERGVTLDPEHRETTSNFVEAACNLGRFEKLQGFLALPISTGAKAHCVFALTRFLSRSGFSNEARETLDALAALEPAHPGIEALSRELGAGRALARPVSALPSPAPPGPDRARHR